MTGEYTNRPQEFALAVTGATVALLANSAGGLMGNSLAFKNLTGFFLMSAGMLILVTYVWVFIAAFAAIPFLLACKISVRFGITHVAYFLAFGAITGILPFLIFSALSPSPLSIVLSFEGWHILLRLGALPGIVGAFLFWLKAIKPLHKALPRN